MKPETIKLIAEILEVIMIVSFGASWPFNVIKSFKARTTKGKSLTFLCLIFFGYIAGVAMKAIKISTNDYTGLVAFISWLALGVYILNLLMVGTDLVLYFRNKKLDKLAELK